MLKLNVSKVIFLVCSSFEKKLKILKITQMHQKKIEFFDVFVIFWILLKNI